MRLEEYEQICRIQLSVNVNAAAGRPDHAAADSKRLSVRNLKMHYICEVSLFFLLPGTPSAALRKNTNLAKCYSIRQCSIHGLY